MAQAKLSRGCARFGVFEADLVARELRRNGVRVKLQEQPFQVLAVLLERSGKVVTREELRQKLWPADTFVDFDNGLNTAINKIREALGDSADTPRFVETLPRRGYRFNYPVDGLETARQPAPLHQLPPVVLRLAVGFAVVLVFVGGYFAWKSWRTPRPPAYAKMVVLPFVNLSSDAQQEFFSDALTDEMIAQLGGLQPERLGVIARTTAMQYKGTKKTAREIGRELGADYILESSVQRAGDRVRITTQLISVRDETHLWSESYDRDLRDILLLRRDVAQAVANAIQIKLTPQVQSRLADARPLNPQAYDLYLMGMYHTEKEWSSPAYEKGRQFFQKSIDADPTYAPPYAALANIYVDLCLFGRLAYREALPMAKAAALKSLELDQNLPEAHAALGNVKFLLEWDWWGAEKDFHRATELHLTRLTGLRKYVRYLMLTGRAEEGLAFHKRMIELDPLSTDLRVFLGWTLEEARQYDEGIRHLQQMLEQDPNLPRIAHYHLAWNYAMAGRYAEAAAECEKIHDEQTCAYAYAALGHREQALAFARKNERDDPVFTASAYVALGDKEKAFQLLERGYQEHLPDMAYIWASPELDSLHSDPRWKDLVRRMNFPPNPVKQ
jgi:TolB-like protein/DNA-binding winged helix-turn-helix (wHTH) protein